MTKTTKMGFAVALASMLLAGLPALSPAQSDPTSKVISSLEFQQADVREVLRSLFKEADASYSVAPDVQGTVTVSLKHVNFETALQNIVRQVDATYRVTGGVYEIIKRPIEDVPIKDTVVVPLKSGKRVQVIMIRKVDPALIALLLSGGQSYAGSPEITSLGRFITGSMGGGGNGQGSGFGNNQGSGFGNGMGSGFGSTSGGGNAIGGNGGGRGRG